MRASLDISNFPNHEISPLIPDPPIKRPRIKQRSDICHSCWSRFTCCSKWMCIFITVCVIILVLIIARSVLPFGWPWWFPNIFYDSSDPHIIFIVADDLGWADVGYGGAEFTTSSVDYLKEHGISLERMYVHESGAATRGAFLTGIPGYSLGLQSGIETGSSAHLPLDVATLPQLLKRDRGYATHMVGKWGLGYSKWDYTPTSRGFDSFLGFHQRYVDYWQYSATISLEKDDSDANKNEMLMGYDLWKDKAVYTPSTKFQYITELFDVTIDDIIDTHVNGHYYDQPMFLYYAIPTPHAPIEYHYEYKEECGALKNTADLIRYKYCNLIQQFDNSVAHVVNKLKATGMWDNSIVVVTSDNGGLPCVDIGSTATCSGAINIPLRGGKGTLFEGSIRVRTVISGGYVDGDLHNTINTDYIHATDLFASLATAANIPEDTTYSALDGVPGVVGISFWDRINGPTDDNLPVREYPFIADMKLDPSWSYIEKAAVYWKGYKYVIQPPASYDGWWSTPIQGITEVPEQSKGTQFDPQPITNKNQQKELYKYKYSPNTNSLLTVLNNDNTAEDEENNDIDDDTSSVEQQMLLGIKVNEYLFLIDDDPNETMNIRLNPNTEEILNELRLYLDEISIAPLYSQEQDYTTNAASNPSNFDNVWYPFEENY